MYVCLYKLLFNRKAVKEKHCGLLTTILAARQHASSQIAVQADIQE